MFDVTIIMLVSSLSGCTVYVLLIANHCVSIVVLHLSDFMGPNPFVYALFHNQGYKVYLIASKI